MSLRYEYCCKRLGIFIAGFQFGTASWSSWNCKFFFVFVFSFNNYAISDVYIDMLLRYDYCCKRLGIFIAGFQFGTASWSSWNCKFLFLLFVFVFSFNNYAMSDVYIDMSLRYDYCCKRLGIFIAGFQFGTASWSSWNCKFLFLLFVFVFSFNNYAISDVYMICHYGMNTVARDWVFS